MREESSTKESSKEEEEAYQEYVREAELVRSQAPMSFNCFSFHLDFEEFCVFFFYFEVL